MDRGQRLAQVAERVVEARDLLQAARLSRTDPLLRRTNLRARQALDGACTPRLSGAFPSTQPGTPSA